MLDEHLLDALRFGNCGQKWPDILTSPVAALFPFLIVCEPACLGPGSHSDALLFVCLTNQFRRPVGVSLFPVFWALGRSRYAIKACCIARSLLDLQEAAGKITVSGSSSG